MKFFDRLPFMCGAGIIVLALVHMVCYLFGYRTTTLSELIIAIIGMAISYFVLPEVESVL